MKHMIRTILAAAVIILTAGCTGDKENASPFRRQMEQVQGLGIWQEGKQIIAFSRTGSQYWCSPDDKLIRILDNDGQKHTDLQLQEMPAEGRKVSGTLTGNMGLNSAEVKDLYILKQDTRNVWLWSDESNVGLVLPKYGIL